MPSLGGLSACLRNSTKTLRAARAGRIANSDSYSRRIKFDRTAKAYEACCCKSHVVDCALYLGVTSEVLATSLAFVALLRDGGGGLEGWVNVGAAVAVLACANLFFLGMRLRKPALFWPHYACLVSTVTSAGYFCYEELESLSAAPNCRILLLNLLLVLLYLAFILVSYVSIYAAMRVRRFLLDWAEFEAAFGGSEDREQSRPLAEAPSVSDSQPSLIVLHF